MGCTTPWSVGGYRGQHPAKRHELIIIIFLWKNSRQLHISRVLLVLETCLSSLGEAAIA